MHIHKRLATKHSGARPSAARGAARRVRGGGRLQVGPDQAQVGARRLPRVRWYGTHTYICILVLHTQLAINVFNSEIQASKQGDIEYKNYILCSEFPIREIPKHFFLSFDRH